jgi:putative transposase
VNRQSIDPALLKVEEWPTIDTNALSPMEATIVKGRIEAVQLYVQGEHSRKILEQTSIARDKVYRFFNRCIKPHLDGRIWGFRGCGYYTHVDDYTRTKVSTDEDRRRTHGHSGLLKQVFERYPSISEDLLTEALKSRNKYFTESSLRLDKLHRRFLALCRCAGIPKSQYPFCVESQGQRSLSRWLKAEMVKRNLRRTVNVCFGEDSARRLGNLGPAVRIGDVKICYDRVEFDGHRIDVFAAIEVTNPTGGEPLVLVVERVWILTAIDVASRAVLGYHIAFGRHYSAEDVLMCLEACIVPWQPRKLRANGLFYPEGSGYPSGSIPGLEFARWNELAFDNDMSNCSNWVWDRVRDEIGCRLNPGPVKTPERRIFIERFFRTLAENGTQRLPVTTGSCESDPRRRNPEEKAVKYDVRLEDLIDFVDVVVATYNGTPTSALFGRTPLDYLRFAQERGSFVVRQIPEAERQGFALTKLSVRAVVKGNVRKGERLYVRYMGVRYYSERLSSSPQLRNQKGTIQVNTRDLRRIRLFLGNGQEFGELIASQEWAGTAHDLRTRKAMLKCIRQGRLARVGIPDVVEHFIRKKEACARHSRKARNEFAHLARVKKQGALKQPLPLVRAPPPPELRRPQPPLMHIQRMTLNF